MKIKSKNYQDYIIKDGKFIGEFEEMYQNIDDPWHHKNAATLQYDLVLYLIDKYKICSKGGKILDIGCGKGAFTARFKKARPKTQILAVDISPTAIKKAKQKYRHLGIDFRVMNIKKEYKNIKNRFDLIIISQLMWYILLDFRSIVNYLIKNTLKKGGYLLINQAFYKPRVQKYGKEIIANPEDMLKLIKLKPIERIESGKMISDSYNVTVFFENR